MELKYSTYLSHSRHLRITVYPDGRVRVSVPKHARPHDVERFVALKRKWIEAKLAYFRDRQLKAKEIKAKRQALCLKFKEELQSKYGDFNVEKFNSAKSNQKNTPKNIAANKTANKTPALHLIQSRLKHWRAYYAGLGHVFSYNQVRVKNQRTRWGSCSRRRNGTHNLNFNWRLSILPPKMADYIIIHELCHVAEMNHGARFWRLVALAMPDYKEVRGDLRKIGVVLG